MDETVIQIMRTVKAISGMVKRQKGPHFLESGVKDLTLSQLDLLAYLFENKKAKMSDLAKNAGVKMPSMTETVNRLVALGVLKREHDEKDRRTVWVYLNKEVERMVQSHIKNKEKQFTMIFDVLSENEKKQALNILKKIQKKMERE